ncbi:MAG: M28 family peptidase [Gemmatimonadales bacterium]
MRKPMMFAVLATALILPAAAMAQGSATTEPVLKRIWSIGMDSSWTEPLSHALFDSLGPRLTGSPDQHRANDWLVRMYKSWGIDVRNEQYGTWRGWRRGYSHIDLISPRVRSLEGTMLGWSPGTHKKDLTASTIILPHFNDSTEFVAWLPQAKGKLVLVAPAQPTCRPMEDWTASATPESKARMDSLRAAITTEWRERIKNTGYSLALGTGSLGIRMEQAGVAGFLTSRPKDAWGTIEIFETYDTKAPAVALSCEDYGLVYRLTEDNDHPKVRLNLDADLLGEQPVFNTIATIPGTSKPNEYVMLSAHFDSWDGSSGATDNGTGTVTMMEAMRILRMVDPHPTRTILVGHWSAEEEGLVGSRAFTEDHPEVIKGLQVLMNQDNGTGRIVHVGGGGFPDAAAHLQRWIDSLPAVYQQQLQFGGAGLPGGGGSDHASFVCWGAPAIELGSLPWNYFNYTWHTNRDTYDKIVFDDLRSNATLVAMLAYLAAEDPTTVSRERVDLVALAAQHQALVDSAKANPADTALARRAGLNGPFARFFRVPTTWPACEKAPRTTNPRLR